MVKKYFYTLMNFQNIWTVVSPKMLYELLFGLGYEVAVVDHLDSARALISKGFLKQAKVCATTKHSLF